MKPGEHKTVQSRILAYAQAIGWTFVPREEAEQRRGGIPAPSSSKSGGWKTPAPLSLFFDDLLDAKVRKFNPRYAEAKGALLGQFRHLHTDIYGNREFVGHLRNRGKFFDHEEKRERDLILIDYEHPAKNVYEVTEEWAFHNGRYGTREDVVFLINGIPVLVIECKNASKDEAIALGVDQIRRYHRETPELFVSQQLFTATDAIGFAYGVTWNTVRRNIFNWKLTEGGHSCPPGRSSRGQECPHSVRLRRQGRRHPHRTLFATPSEERRYSRNTKRSRCFTKSSLRIHSCAPTSTTTALCPRYTMWCARPIPALAASLSAYHPAATSAESSGESHREHARRVAERLARSVKPAERKAPGANDLPAATHH